MKKIALDIYRNRQATLDLEKAVASLPEHLSARGKELLGQYYSLGDPRSENQRVAGLIVEDAVGLLLFAHHAASACDLAMDFGCTYKVRPRGAELALSRWSSWAQSDISRFNQG